MIARATTRRVVRLALAQAVAIVALAIPATANAQNPFAGVTSDETFVALGSNQPSSIDGIAGAGVGTIRQTFDWQFLARGQPQGQLNWTFLDRFIEATARHGITVMPVLFDPPDELTSRPPGGGERGTYPPRDLGAIGDFGAALASHYGSGGSFWDQHPAVPRHPITAWQIWNEPNLPVYWRPRPDPAAYVTMLRLAAQRIKSVDPGAEIVTAGLPESHINGSVRLVTYLDRMYRGGANGAFDTLALNAYSRTGSGVTRKVRKFRRLINHFGDADAGLRVTEFGWADRGPEHPRARYTAGPGRQGTYLAAAVRGLWRKRNALRLRGFVYYAWRDQGVYAGGKNFWGLYTGLNRRNGRAKPALRSFQRALRRLR